MRNLVLVALVSVLCVGAVAGCTSSRSLGASFDDIGASAKIKRVLFADRSHDYSDIDITLSEGRLLLTGTMRSEQGRRKLVENAWKAESIKTVIDQIVVGDKTSFKQGVEDSRIDTAIRSKLIGDRGLRSSDYGIAVSNGVVYAIGVAPNDVALERFLNHARSTSGVSEVVSHIIYLGEPIDRL